MAHTFSKKIKKLRGRQTAQQLIKGVSSLGVPYQGGNQKNQGFGTLGGGSKQSINPHGLQTSMLNFLSSLQPPQVTPPKKATALNLPNAYNVLSDTYRMYSKERLGGKSFRRGQRYTGQQISNAEENIEKYKVLSAEDKASRGIRPGTGSKTGLDIAIESKQQNVELAKAKQYEEKSRWKRQKLHRILFG